ncbi:MAG TPA: class I SAM-dependent methyltransferase [Opitutaceae bacterium]|jgi:SAM-dependent methyltransferase
MPLPPELIDLRQRGYALLAGTGIEVGALHEPARLPSETDVTYVDALTTDDARRLFPEIGHLELTPPDVVLDIDRDGLNAFATGSLDFVVMSHVLEHLANPIRALTEVFRVLKPGGHAALAVPDKRFTFDRPRRITEFAHLWTDFLNEVEVNPDEHYADFVHAVNPAVRALSPEDARPHLQYARERHEHCHVWDSETIRDFLFLVPPLCGFRARLRFESRAIKITSNISPSGKRFRPRRPDSLAAIDSRRPRLRRSPTRCVHNRHGRWVAWVLR